MKLDVSVWEGREIDGKPMPSSLSVRVQQDEGEKPVSVYLDVGEALSLAALLEHYSREALETDRERRLDAWKARQQETPVLVPA